MKQVIKAKVYNTDTAREIGGYESGESSSDMDWHRHTLYCTKIGQYLVHNEGGLRAGFNQYIELLSPEAALDWASVHCDGDVVVTEFRSQIEEG